MSEIVTLNPDSLVFLHVPPETRILLVEDSPIQSKVVIKIIKKLGYPNVSHCADSVLAMEAIRDDQTQLVLCDYQMPVVSGIDLLKQVRSSTDFKKIPFFIVTAHAEKDLVVEAFKCGVSDLIVKPLVVSTLVEKFMKINIET